MHSTLEVLLASLSHGPSVINALAAACPDDLATWREGEGRWNCLEVLSHLADGEITDWMPRVEVILSGGRRFPPYDREGGFERYRGWSRLAIAEEFGRLRHVNLKRLEDAGLGARDLDLTGEHPEFGTVTLEQLLATWVVHDLGHVAQIGRVMAKQYREVVGPWEAYLPVLHR